MSKRKFNTNEYVTVLTGEYSNMSGFVESYTYDEINDEFRYKVKLENGYTVELGEHQMMDDGEASVEYIAEMAQIGWYNEKNRNERDSTDTKSVWIYAEGRPEAHFHFYRGKLPSIKGRIIPGGGCIMLTESRYFSHDTHTETLNKVEVELLVDYLESIDPNTSLTVWRATVASWNQNNWDHQIDPNIKMPPYRDGIRPYKAK